MKKFVILILSLTTALSTFAQTKTITNADLEKFRQQRVESEKKLKERYAEMGFPSPEQIERQNAERRAELEEYADYLREQKIQSQNDIIAQANILRSQIAAVDAQINYLRRQGSTYYSSPFIYSYGYAPFGFRGNHFSPRNQSLPRNSITGAQNYALMYPNAQDYFNQALGVRTGSRIGGGGIGGGRGRVGSGRRGFNRGGYFAPVIVGDYYNSNDNSSQLIYLEQQRAGLLAQWNILEEQARRAGIRID